MNGNGLDLISDNNFETSYASEDAPDFSGDGQYFQYDWNKPVNINLVALYSKFCGTNTKDGQAPTEWKILTSTDGINYSEAASVTNEWHGNDELQSKTVKFTTNENFISMRIVIENANLSWNHYSIYEIVTDTVSDDYIISDLTGEVTPELTVSYNSEVMNGIGLDLINDNNFESSYASEDAPDFSGDGQYFQYDWNKPVDINLVALYSKFCGTNTKDGQAPTKWKILTSTDGINYSEAASVTSEWHGNDELQSKTVKFTTNENFISMRIVIENANLSWNHYSIYEIVTDTVSDDYIISDLTGSIEQSKIVEPYLDSNNVVQYASSAFISYNSKAMSGSGLSFISDRDYETAYVSEDNPDMTAQYIEYNWSAPIDINLVTLYSKYCGTKSKDGQAPTKWSISVSKDGVNYSDVCDVKKSWRSNDNIQSKSSQFDEQRGIVAMRIRPLSTNLGWQHYAIYEIEIGHAPEGYISTDLTGISSDNDIPVNKIPIAGDFRKIILPLIIVSVSVFSLVRYVFILRKKRTFFNQ